MSKKFSTSKASREVMSPEVIHWRENSQPEDRATLVFRLQSHADPSMVAAELVEMGVETESVGDEVITGNVAGKDVNKTLAVKSVLSVELPQKLSMKSGDDIESLLSSSGSKPFDYKLPE